MEDLIKTLTIELMSQREMLIKQLNNLDNNSVNYHMKKVDLSSEINVIDTEIKGYVAQMLTFSSIKH